MTADIEQYFQQLDKVPSVARDSISCSDLGLKVGSAGWDVQQSFIIKRDLCTKIQRHCDIMNG